jgi:competence protein ComEC
VAFYAAVALALRVRGTRRAACAAVALAALTLPGPARRAAATHRAALEVVFLGVGQGDATLLRLPDGSGVLVDGGGDPQGRADPGARDIVPFLRDAGISTLAAAFLSHAHPDHLGGLPSVHAAIPFERLFASGRPAPPEARAALARLPPAEPFPRGATWERAGVRIEALGPPPGSGAWSENDASLVLRVTYGATRLLLLGDVEAEGESALVAAGGLAADVVKVAHHGSATSSTPPLVDAVRPRYAVACVGHENRYRFPAAATVERWREAGADVFRTDAGTVRFVSDGRTVRATPAASALDAVALWRERP